MKLTNFKFLLKFTYLIFLINIISLNYNSNTIFAKELTQNAKIIFEKGNDFYKNQNYIEAINNYKLLIDNGIKNADLFFNLANSYYKNEEIGLSIVYYEKALLLKPSDEDIYFNLQVANLKTVDKFNTVEMNPITKNINSFIYSFHSNNWVYLSILFLVLTIAFVIILLLNIKKIRSLSLLVSILSITIFVIFTFFAYYTYINQTSNKSGVLILTNAYVKFSPDEKSENLIMIHEGTKFDIIEKINNWTKIKLPDGNIGWIDNNNLMDI